MRILLNLHYAKLYVSRLFCSKVIEENPLGGRLDPPTLGKGRVNPSDICVLLDVLLLVLNFKSYSLLFIIQIFSLLVYEGSFGKVQQLL